MPLDNCSNDLKEVCRKWEGDCRAPTPAGNPMRNGTQCVARRQDSNVVLLPVMKRGHARSRRAFMNLIRPHRFPGKRQAEHTSGRTLPTWSSLLRCGSCRKSVQKSNGLVQDLRPRESHRAISLNDCPSKKYTELRRAWLIMCT